MTYEHQQIFLETNVVEEKACEKTQKTEQQYMTKFKMRKVETTVLTFFFISFSLSLAVALDECPSGWFNVAWVAAVDRIVPIDIGLQFFDPNFTYFKEVLQYSNEEIQDVTQRAIKGDLA